MPYAKHFEDAVHSRIQSVLAELLRRHHDVAPEKVHDHPLLREVGELLHAKTSGKKPPDGAFVECLEVLVQYLEALVRFDFKTAMEKRNEFIDAQCDPGWIEAAAVWFWHYHVEHKKPRYVVLPHDEGCYPLQALPSTAAKPPGVIRVGLIADWATGTEVSCLVLDELFKQGPDVILHLGDVYYAGTAHENRVNAWEVLEKKRRQHASPVPFYNLAGNHDYYSGGHGFYEYLDRFNHGIDAGSVQQASYFVLRNGEWQLQAMDTGYHDSDLEDVGADTTFLRPDEIAWHKAQIANAGDRRVILFSHHQLFSSRAGIGRDKNWYNPALVDALTEWKGALQKDGSIPAWFWGHEHLLTVYRPPTEPPKGESGFEWPIGRCIGCGAFPVLYDGGVPYRQRPVEEAPVRFVDDPNHPGQPLELGTTQDGEAYNHGYVILDLEGPRACVRYYEVPGDGLPFKDAKEGEKYSRLRYEETL